MSPQSFLFQKPANVTLEQAAAVPVAALTALQGLRDKGQIQPSEESHALGTEILRYRSE